MPRIVSAFILLIASVAYLDALDPLREYILRPEDFGLPYSEQKLVTTDGYALNSWLILPSEDVPVSETVYVISYGDAGNMGYSLAYAMLLANHGHRILMFDYRGFGQSDDFSIDTARYYYNVFATDLEAAIMYARSLDNTKTVGLLSFSMGTIMGVLAFPKTPFDFWVCEGLVTDPSRCMDRVEKLTGKDLKAARKINRPKKLLKKIDIPVLVFAALRDAITTPGDARAFVGDSPQRELIEVDAEHLRCAAGMGPAVYIGAVERFRKKYL